MYFLMTNDVESFSIPLNKLDYNTAREVYKVGLPRLLDVYAKHDIKCTFYFTGEIIESVPETLELVLDYGHDIGCHGFSHSHNRTFDSMNLYEQIAELKKAKHTIEKIAGRIYDFRAPALRINEFTIRALEQTGFNTDSSVASQRFDGPFTFGSKRKLKWLVAPRNPYYPSYDSVMKKGASNILEIPISAYFFSYIGTTMRISPLIVKILEKFLFAESQRTEKPIVFLFHPNECLDAKTGAAFARRANNVVEYIFADVIRNRLKVKNLGTGAVRLISEVIKRSKKAGAEFVTMQDYRKLME
ncbi:4-deoxy-4-formamido-L-arabinose-phosphoundecaprenol deformylase ArnD [uncultured archaeon]|nr:4-deoxy-4-formamido-L-arabinose-phosphoundecaprenol deformylase ArnD [uncultured archaeon]